MAINRLIFHPDLRSLDESFLNSRSSWLNFMFHVEERINWYGDVQLYCRESDYQSLLNSVPCPTVGEGVDRRCALEGGYLDQYRLDVKVWLSQFGEGGKVLPGVEIPVISPINPSTPPSITAGPVPSPKRAPWFAPRRKK